MTIRLGIIMDPIAKIRYQNENALAVCTLALLWEAQSRGWEIYYFEQQDLFLRGDVPYGRARILNVFQDETTLFEFKNEMTLPLADLQVILMRTDPPIDQEYLYTTYLLDYAEQQGVLVINKPQSLRDCNEKLFMTQFSQCIPPTLVAQSKEELRAFWQEHRDIVCKPLNAMGGASVFRLKEDDVNVNVVFEVLTKDSSRYLMAQKFIPEIKQGDKRILMINGEPIPHVLARIPQDNDWRGNLGSGAQGVIQPLTERDRWICAQVGPILRDRGLYFVGLDVIGDYLTEINLTSAGCIREIDAGAGTNVSKVLFDFIETKLK